MITSTVDAVTASKGAVVEWQGRWYGDGLVHATEAEAAATVTRHAVYAEAARQKNGQLTAIKVGNRIDGATIHGVGTVDGELCADTVKVIYGTSARSTVDKTRPVVSVVVAYDVVAARAEPEHQCDTVIRAIAKHVGATRTVDSGTIELHHIIRRLANRAGQLDANPLPAPRPTTGNGTAKPAGWIDRVSLIEPGQFVWTNADHGNADGDQPMQGGLCIAATDLDTGRVFTVVRDNVEPAAGGSAYRLGIGHIHADNIHTCGEPGCITCPTAHGANNHARRLFRTCHAELDTRQGPLAPEEHRTINLATTILRTIL